MSEPRAKTDGPRWRCPLTGLRTLPASARRSRTFQQIGQCLPLAISSHTCAISVIREKDWRGNRFKEREVRNAIGSVLGDDEGLIEAIFAVAKAQGDY